MKSPLFTKFIMETCVHPVYNFQQFTSKMVPLSLLKVIICH